MVINEENIDKYREKLNVNLKNCIKELVLNFIESSYSYLLKNDKFNEEILDNLAYEIQADDHFNDTLDSMIIDKIEECIKENELEEDDEEEEEEI